MHYAKKMLKLVGLAISITAISSVAHAESWPERPVRMIVPYPAGGGTDFTARLIAQELSKKTGQNFIVENRTGASGAIGAQSVVQSQPDGYTVLFASPAEVLVSAIAGQKTSYDPQKDLEPVTLAGETPLGIVINPASPVKSLAELLTQAKKASSELSYGTPGAGSTMQFAGEALNLTAKTKILHIPYRGAAPAIADLLGNQIPMAIVGIPPIITHQQSGKLKILAVTSTQRSSALPDVPAVAELPGFSDYRYTNWFGVFVPKGTNPAIVTKLSSLFHDVLQQEAIRKQLIDQGVEPVGNTPAEFAAFLASEKAKYQAVQQKSGIKIE